MDVKKIEYPSLPDTRETLPDTIEFLEFDHYYDEATARGLSLSEAAQYAGTMILGQSN